ncbi:uncharacterized protein LOC127565385 [Drosophila albomicans]|uniref:Uncharacterized protein LOC127565385 n=1 Tax=Drosophila albomicans TaxID=7291 RepID=A0A9C6W4Z0_DROAB|nr:uncharacterized protein LOC127565385 [Drosophila albomicans]
MSLKFALCLCLALWCGIAVAIEGEPAKTRHDDYDDIDDIEEESNTIALASAIETGEEEALLETETATLQGSLPYYLNNPFIGYPPYFYPGYPRPGSHGHHHGYRPYSGWPYPGYYSPGYPGYSVYPGYPGYQYPGYPNYGYPYPNLGYPFRGRESTEDATKICSKTILGLGRICTTK